MVFEKSFVQSNLNKGDAKNPTIIAGFKSFSNGRGRGIQDEARACSLPAATHRGRGARS
jgi:hypothetical protein